MLFSSQDIQRIIALNTKTITNKLFAQRTRIERGLLSRISREDAYQDKFRSYSILASKGQVNPLVATSFLNQEFPEQATTTQQTMNSLFPL